MTDSLFARSRRRLSVCKASGPRAAGPLGLWAAGALVVSLAAFANAPGGSAGAASSGVIMPASTQAPLPPITFDDLYQAQQSAAVRIVQERRTLRPNLTGPGAVVDALREQLILGGTDPNGQPLFRLELLSILDPSGPIPPNSSQTDRFDGHAAYLQKHSGFRIEDPALAEQNYLLVPIGLGSRPLIADYQQALSDPTAHPFSLPGSQLELRAVGTLVAVPRHVSRSPWLLEVDVMTNRILRSVSYDSLAVPLCETVVVHESDPPVGGPSTNWWQPTQPTTEHPDLASAVASLPAAPWIAVEQSQLPEGYDLSSVRVVRQAFGPKVSVIQIFGDGVDELFVVQTLNAPRAFATNQPGSDAVILTHRDRDVAQFLFHVNALETAVVGRAGHNVLSQLAAELLILATSSGE